jgi:tRNA-Thr(GGU) m(6)t(6)A37 methyltransferase TsaA
VLVAATGAVLWTAPEWLVARLAEWYPGCLYRVSTQAPLVALTIDDGPDPRTTPLILAELARQGARATFFLIGERVNGQEMLVRRLVAEGHELGNHFMRDRPSIRLSPRAFETELLQADRVLAGYAPVKWARPGSGWYSRAMLDVMRRHGYGCALGSVYPFDAAIPSSAIAARFVLRHARPGAVVVLHDGGRRGERTARTLRAVLPQLHRRGYRVVSLSELVAAANPLQRERLMNTSATYSLRPIGWVRSSLKRCAEAPKQGFEGAPNARLQIEPAFLRGLDGIQPGQDVVILTWLHEAQREVLAVHPRDDAARPLTGVFATRSADRPNPIGLHRVKVLKIEEGGALEVQGLEAIDGTPVIDLKPVLTQFNDR